MKTSKALRALADITASQWGMVTTAQAGMHGVTRLTLHRLADAGHLERLAHGVYRDAGATSDELGDLRVAWLSTEPKVMAEERLRVPVGGVVVASTSAALIHGVGDMWATRHEFVTPKRRQTQREEIRYRQRALERRDVTLVEGLPVMTLERTLADLLEDVGELSLVADALGEAVKKRSLDLKRLRELFGPLAERNGFKRHDGNAVLDHLLEIAGLDLDSVAQRIAADPVLSSKLFEDFLGAVRALDMPDLRIVSQQIGSLPMDGLIGDIHIISDAIRPQVRVFEDAQRALAGKVSPDIGKAVADLVNSSALGNISQQWAKDIDVQSLLTSGLAASSTNDEGSK